MTPDQAAWVETIRESIGHNVGIHDRDEPLAALDALVAELERLNAHRCGLPSTIIEALNSGDGVYRP